MKKEIMLDESCEKNSRVQDDSIMEEKWRLFSESISPKLGEALSGEITEAMRDLYSIFSVDVLKWSANPA